MVAYLKKKKKKFHEKLFGHCTWEDNTTHGKSVGIRGPLGSLQIQIQTVL